MTTVISDISGLCEDPSRLICVNSVAVTGVDSTRCGTSGYDPACQGGFFNPSYNNSLPNGGSVGIVSTTIAPCCPGYFCSRTTTCMQLCSQGSTCITGTVNASTNSCNPSSTSKVSGVCSGAATDSACPPGYYCPTPLEEPILCPKNHFCYTSTSYPQKCTSFMRYVSSSADYCPAGSTFDPKEDQSAIIFGIIAFVLLLIIRNRRYWMQISYKDVIRFNEILFPSNDASQSVQSRLNQDPSPLGRSAAAPINQKPSNSLSIFSRSKAPQMPIDEVERQQEIVLESITLEDVRIWRDGNLVFTIDYDFPSPGKNLHIYPGITAIVGLSGAGKSTLLDVLALRSSNYHSLCGHVNYFTTSKIRSGPDNTLRLTKKDAMLKDYRAFHKDFGHRVGFVSQNSEVLAGPLTVWESVLFSARLRTNFSYGECQRRAFFWLKTLQLAKKPETLRQLTTSLSGGEKRRVTVAVELVADPLIVYLDEPTSGLDTNTTEVLLQALHRFSRGDIVFHYHPDDEFYLEGEDDSDDNEHDSPGQDIRRVPSPHSSEPNTPHHNPRTPRTPKLISLLFPTSPSYSNSGSDRSHSRPTSGNWQVPNMNRSSFAFGAGEGENGVGSEDLQLYDPFYIGHRSDLRGAVRRSMRAINIAIAPIPPPRNPPAKIARIVVMVVHQPSHEVAQHYFDHLLGVKLSPSVALPAEDDLEGIGRNVAVEDGSGDVATQTEGDKQRLQLLAATQRYQRKVRVARLDLPMKSMKQGDECPYPEHTEPLLEYLAREQPLPDDDTINSTTSSLSMGENRPMKGAPPSIPMKPRQSVSTTGSGSSMTPVYARVNLLDRYILSFVVPGEDDDAGVAICKAGAVMELDSAVAAAFTASAGGHQNRSAHSRKQVLHASMSSDNNSADKSLHPELQSSSSSSHRVGRSLLFGPCGSRETALTMIEDPSVPPRVTSAGSVKTAEIYIGDIYASEKSVLSGADNPGISAAPPSLSNQPSVSSARSNKKEKKHVELMIAVDEPPPEETKRDEYLLAEADQTLLKDSRSNVNVPLDSSNEERKTRPPSLLPTDSTLPIPGATPHHLRPEDRSSSQKQRQSRQIMTKQAEERVLREFLQRNKLPQSPRPSFPQSPPTSRKSNGKSFFSTSVRLTTNNYANPNFISANEDNTELPSREHVGGLEIDLEHSQEETSGDDRRQTLRQQHKSERKYTPIKAPESTDPPQETDDNLFQLLTISPWFRLYPCYVTALSVTWYSCLPRILFFPLLYLCCDDSRRREDSTSAADSSSQSQPVDPLTSNTSSHPSITPNAATSDPPTRTASSSIPADAPATKTLYAQYIGGLLRFMSTFSKHVYLGYLRSLSCVLHRFVNAYVVNAILALSLGLALGFFHQDMSLLSSKLLRVTSAAYLLPLALSLVCVQTGLQHRMPNRIAHIHEAQRGIHAIAIYLGESILEMSWILTAPVYILIFFLSWSRSLASFRAYYIILMAVSFTACSVGHLLATQSIWAEPAPLGIYFNLFLALMTGYIPFARDLKASMGGATESVLSLSYLSFAFQGLLQAEYGSLPSAFAPVAQNYLYNYDISGGCEEVDQVVYDVALNAVTNATAQASTATVLDCPLDCSFDGCVVPFAVDILCYGLVVRGIVVFLLLGEWVGLGDRVVFFRRRIRLGLRSLWRQVWRFLCCYGCGASSKR